MTLLGQQLAQAISQAHGPELPPMPKLVRTPAEFLAVHCPGNQHAAVDLECLIRRAVQTALRDKAEKVAEVMEQP